MTAMTDLPERQETPRTDKLEAAISEQMANDMIALMKSGEGGTMPNFAATFEAMGVYFASLTAHGRNIERELAAKEAAEAALKEAQQRVMRNAVREGEAMQRAEKAESERDALKATLREASEVISKLADGPSRANWGDMLDKIDIALGEAR